MTPSLEAGVLPGRYCCTGSTARSAHPSLCDSRALPVGNFSIASAIGSGVQEAIGLCCAGWRAGVGLKGK
jgi:hypothetical protein